ncbi:MAG TPA: hypothetical protein VFR22_10410 [Nocardioidaceae bacterium]|nr:hypothetical protein [Nocardioidaceae bacterium]
MALRQHRHGRTFTVGSLDEYDWSGGSEAGLPNELHWESTVL